MDSIANNDPLMSIHTSVGGDQPFYDLVNAFYSGLEADPILRPMYPKDINGAKSRLALFLIQRFGGSFTYSETRGHPRLRMRHMRFRVGRDEVKAWLTHMSAALESVPVFEPYREELKRYFEHTAAFLLNTNEAGKMMCCGNTNSNASS